MKWKTVVAVVVVLLVAALACVADYALESDATRATKARIKQYRIVAMEQSLIRQILEDKVAVAKIQAQFAPPPAPATPAPVPVAPE